MSQNMGITSLYLDRVGGAGPGVVDGVLTRSVFDLVFTSAGHPVAHVVKLPAAYAVKFENYRMAGLISASEARTIGGTTLLANHRAILSLSAQRLNAFGHRSSSSQSLE